VFAILETFLHTPWMLAGLLALAIPPIIHLLNRRRFDVVDWGAMQFLQVSEVTRRRLMLEEVLLMVVRMGLLGVLVLALAGPFLDVRLPAGFGPRASRDVVLLLDGSSSMTATDELSGSSPAEKAREWARAYVEELSAGDGVALLVAREQVEPLVGSLSSDRARVRELLGKEVYCAGSANWPEAVKQADAILAGSQKLRREVIVLSDNQKFGWADADTLFRWELLASELGAKATRPRLWAVNLAPDRDAAPPNYGLAPLVSNRPVVAVDREVTFKTELLLVGQPSYSPPYKIRLEVDGKHVRDLTPPAGKGDGMPVPKDGRMPFSFAHRFQKAGSHLVSVVLEPDPPPEDRPPGYVLKDRVPGDNRQDFAVEVLPALPVLLVDGAASASAGQFGSDFLRDALSPARDRTPAVQTRVVAVGDFAPALLTGEPRPLVLILHDVSRLSASQAEGVAAFLAEGGGVLVTLGERAEQGWYNEQLYRGGDGWLPARLDGIAGEEARLQDAVRPDPATFAHPVLELFQKVTTGGLAEARFPRWWRLSTPGQHSPGVPVGQLTAGATKTPLFVERAFKAGRVLLCAVPLDASWGSNLVDLPAFVPLVHEAVYYLAGARSAEYNLRAGQPLRLRVSADATLDRFQLQPPGGPQWPLSPRAGEAGSYQARLVPQEQGALLVYEGVRNAGVYRVLTPQQQTVFYVVPADPREADLTGCTAEEREKVVKAVGVQYEDERDEILGSAEGATSRQEMWWWLLVGLIGLLCLEVWMTRRLVKNR
jgi:hypothetical protein